MRKDESRQRKLTKKMKLKLAGVFGCSLLALVSLLGGITIINAKSGNRYTQQVLSQSSSSIQIRRFPLSGAVLRTATVPF